MAGQELIWAPAEAREREGFLRFARKCRLGVQALYCNLLTRLCSHEKASALLDYSSIRIANYGGSFTLWPLSWCEQK